MENIEYIKKLYPTEYFTHNYILNDSEMKYCIKFINTYLPFTSIEYITLCNPNASITIICYLNSNNPCLDNVIKIIEEFFHVIKTNLNSEKQYHFIAKSHNIVSFETFVTEFTMFLLSIQ